MFLKRKTYVFFKRFLKRISSRAVYTYSNGIMIQNTNLSLLTILQSTADTNVF